MQPIETIFRQITPAARKQQLDIYNKIINQEQNPGPRHTPMPWMLKYWIAGRVMLIAIMEELNEIHENTVNIP